MNRLDPSYLLSLLRSDVPLSDLDSIREISLFDWNCSGRDEIEVCSDLIIRLTADVIVYNNKQFDPEYEFLFKNIRKKIEHSSILQDSEFNFYFEKFAEYHNEIGS